MHVTPPEKPCPSIVITSHSNADYDALASMVAAGKLYPGAVLIAPSVQERQESHYFADSIAYLFNLQQAKDVDFSNVTTLVVVDTRQPSRIPQVAAVLGKPGLAVHVYDHHPDTPEDLKGEVTVVKQWGSTTTIITELLREKNISVSPDEATMLGLGIYEDTGSFTFSSTTPHDFTAAAWLRERHMDVDIIGELVSHDLTREQLDVLNILLESATSHDIKGITIVIAQASLDVFLGDFALLAHKMMDMENIKVLFATARMGDRVQVVARSRHPDVDVSRICSAFGGGGHSYAASASVKDKTLAEVKAEILALLMGSVNPHMTVGDHMTSPAKTVAADQTLTEAEDIMNRYGLKAVPVVKPQTLSCVGYLEQQTAARAVAHGLGKLPVSEYMHRNVLTVSPDSTLFPAMNIILTQRQRLVPVISNDQVIGVLTRTDVVRLLLEDHSLRIPEGDPLSAPAREKNIRQQLEERLPEEYVDLLRLAGRLGDELGCSVYAVGGFVRDLLMNRPNLDVDLSVEGDGISFAGALAKKLGGRVRPHQKFKTAVVAFTNGQGRQMRVDVATARLEYYEHPGALPTVELSSIKMDLFRRDFTINALAVQVNEDRFGVLVDPFGAQRDMKEKSLNILHSLSFIEDPTRILRAIRFETRFQFRLGAQTERLIKNALQLKMLEKISPSRLFNELNHIFDEKDAAACLERMEEFGILKIIHPLMELSPSKTALLHENQSVLAWYSRLYAGKEPERWVLFLYGLTRNGKYPVVNEVLERLGVTQRMKREFLRLRESIRQAQIQLPRWKKDDASMSGLYATLSRIPVEGILLLMALYHDDDLTKNLSYYLTRMHMEKPDITGEDLKTIGVPPSPLYTAILEEVLAAKLDGKAPSRDDQLRLAETIYMKTCEETVRQHAVDDLLDGRT
ncbi:Polynucleotide adenylyltransferase region [uncultured delta proteobacterium]|uniref:Polynucleotide adenylyltransferase region n=1 Tax=uncultured delta proteobacterium TaxID=34034 RepID=A0A212J436_9DELT|nr:Polynucleotide adenylyltransferase region [uncultured delta proteobacterium]